MFISIHTAAERLEVDLLGIARMILDGDIPPPRIVGGYARYSEAALREWDSAGCPKSERLDFDHPTWTAIYTALRDECEERGETDNT